MLQSVLQSLGTNVTRRPASTTVVQSFLNSMTAPRRARMVLPTRTATRSSAPRD